MTAQGPRREPGLRELAEAATPGPWEMSSDWLSGISDAVGEMSSFSMADAAYIAAASPDRVLALLERIDALETALREVAEPRSCVNCGFEGYVQSDEDAWCSDCETTQPASAEVCPACHHDALGPACPMCGGSFRRDPNPSIEVIEAFARAALAASDTGEARL